MIDLTGVEWLTPTDAAQRLGIDRHLIYVWLRRGVPIRSHRVNRRLAVNMPDVLDAELAWRKRTRGGHRRVVVQVDASASTLTCQ